MQVEIKVGVAIFISNKIDVKIKTVTRDKEELHNDQGSIQKEDITAVNIHAPNMGAPQYIRQMLTYKKREFGSKTVIVKDFNAPLIAMYRLSRQKINKKILTKQQIRQDGLNSHIQKIPSKSRIDILFKCIWKILQDRSHARPQNKTQWI